MREGKQVTKDIFITMYVLITTGEWGVRGWGDARSITNSVWTVFSVNSQASGRVTSDHVRGRFGQVLRSLGKTLQVTSVAEEPAVACCN